SSLDRKISRAANEGGATYVRDAHAQPQLRAVGGAPCAQLPPTCCQWAHRKLLGDDAVSSPPSILAALMLRSIAVSGPGGRTLPDRALTCDPGCPVGRQPRNRRLVGAADERRHPASRCATAAGTVTSPTGGRTTPSPDE